MGTKRPFKLPLKTFGLVMLSQERALDQRFFIKKPPKFSFFNSESLGLACFGDWFSLEMPDVSTVRVHAPDRVFLSAGPACW